MSAYVDLTAQLRQARTEQGLSLLALQERAGIPFQVLSTYERSERRPRADNLVRWAGALGYDVTLVRRPAPPCERHPDGCNGM